MQLYKKLSNIGFLKNNIIIPSYNFYKNQNTIVPIRNFALEKKYPIFTRNFLPLIAAKNQQEQEPKKPCEKRALKESSFYRTVLGS